MMPSDAIVVFIVSPFVLFVGVRLYEVLILCGLIWDKVPIALR